MKGVEFRRNSTPLFCSSQVSDDLSSDKDELRYSEVFNGKSTKFGIFRERKNIETHGKILYPLRSFVACQRVV